MATYTLDNGKICITVDSHGAELRSLQDNKKTEYLWSGNPAYWGRISPVLFPFVGKTNGQAFRTKGREYSMTQHGFARDMEFQLLSQTPTALWFGLESNAETMEKYPYAFRLELGYRLERDALRVFWRVRNRQANRFPSRLAAIRPLSALCGWEKSKPSASCILTHRHLKSHRLARRGLRCPERVRLALVNGYLPLDAHLFDHDALVIEHHQCHEVSLCSPNKKPYLTIAFDAPLFGVWSPAGKHAPFVCIEPWYGRCDAEGFSGTLSEREWGNTLPAGKVFEASYVIQPITD